LSRVKWIAQESTPAASPTTGVTASSLTRSSGLGTSTCSISPGCMSSNGWEESDQGADSSEYFAFTLTVDSGKSLSLTRLSIGTQSSSTGPRAIALYYSGDGFSSALATLTQSQGGTAYYWQPSLTLNELTGTVEFRLIEVGNVQAQNGTSATASGGTFRILDYEDSNNVVGDIVLEGSVSAGSADTTPPAIASSSPAAGDSGIAVDIAAISVDFTEALASSSSASGVTLQCPSGTPISGTAGFSDSDTLSFVPDTGLPAGSTCTLTIPAGALVDASGNANAQALSLSFTTAAPAAARSLPFSEDFASCTLTDWQIVSVDTDTTHTWYCSGGTVQANGYGDSAPADDWLILPPVDMGTLPNPRLSFDSWTQYTDSGQASPQIEVLYSTDYAGSGNPSQVTWLPVSGGTFPAPNTTLTSSGQIDVSGISGSRVYFAFRYRSSGTGSGSSAYWQVDNVSIAGYVPPPLPVGQCGDPATLISAVQGSGDTSPLVGRTVDIEAIVTAVFPGLQGYFLQEEDTQQDGNAQTSEGIFVFDPTPLAAIQVGDEVRVHGTVNEYFNMTEIDAASRLVCAGGLSVTPATLNLPVPNVPNGDLAAAQAAVSSYMERYEGMLVRIPETLSVSDYYELERYGQLQLTQGGRIPTFTAVNAPSVTGNVAHQIEVMRRTLILDDGDNYQNSALINHLALPYPYDPANGAFGLSIAHRFRGGDTITGLTGVLHWSWAGYSGTDAWRIRPVKELYDYTFVPVNPRPTTAPAVGGSLKVAAANTLNFFSTIDSTPSNDVGGCGPTGGLDCRGADSVLERDRQLAKESAALCGLNADIVGLMEIENNATASLDLLVNGLNAVPGCGPYDYIHTGTIGTDAIKVALLYKPAAVETVGDFAILDSSYDPNFVDTKNRPSLAQELRQSSTGETLIVAVNHLKSKGSDCNDLSDPDTGDGQGNCNLTRTQAAQVLTSWLHDLSSARGEPDVLIVGDLNSYAKEDPIAALESAGYTNLVALHGGADAYSYVFDGQTGYLDHALANDPLKAQVTGAAEWHINADEPPSFDYNDTIQDPGESDYEAKPDTLPLPDDQPLYAPDPLRTSDHDPVLIGLELGTAAAAVPGDLNGDNAVSVVDYQIFRQALGSRPGQSNWSSTADYDHDGRITNADYRIWYGYYRASLAP
jgi:uncharacterized protein